MQDTDKIYEAHTQITETTWSYKGHNWLWRNLKVTSQVEHNFNQLKHWIKKRDGYYNRHWGF